MALDKVAIALAVKSNSSVISVDAALDDTSTNPVQNNVITAALDGKASVLTESVTLPTSGWTDDDTVGGEDYPYYIDMSSANVTAAMVPIATVLPAYESVAVECGLCPSCTAIAGATRFYSAEVPGSTITISVSYFY